MQGIRSAGQDITIYYQYKKIIGDLVVFAFDNLRETGVLNNFVQHLL